MQLTITEDLKFLRIIDSTEEELGQFHRSFKKRVRNFFFHPLYKQKKWDGYISFIDKFDRIPLGLYNEVYTIAEKYNYNVSIDNDYLIKDTLDVEDFDKFIEEYYAYMGDAIKRRDYQVNSAKLILQYKRNVSEIATSAGKTFIMWLIFYYLLKKKLVKKILMIVPNTQLILQSEEDFLQYSDGFKLFKVKIQNIHGGTEKVKTDSDIIIGTFQTLCKMDKSFFDGINCVAVDEAHFTNCTSIKKILSNCNDAEYRFGLTGTLQMDGSAEDYTIQAHLGPLVNKISPHFLFKNKYATPVKVKAIIMDYLSDEMKENLYTLRMNKDLYEPSKIFSLEKDAIVHDKKRFKFITNYIGKSTKNSLVLFSNIKHKYGKRVYEYLKNAHCDKQLFYVDGSTDPMMREEFKALMEEGTNKILVASFGTMSTGISINSIHNIFLIENYKSEKIIKQTIGRGMRLKDGKTHVNIIDFVDDFSYNGNKNYVLNHFYDRLNIYEREKFEYKIYKFNF